MHGPRHPCLTDPRKPAPRIAPRIPTQKYCVGMRGDAWGWSPHKICIIFHPHGKSLNDFSTLVSVPTQNSTWVSIPTQNLRFNSVEFRLQSPSPRKISPWYLSPRKLRTSAPVPTQNSDLPWVSETGVLLLASYQERSQPSFLLESPHITFRPDIL